MEPATSLPVREPSPGPESLEAENEALAELAKAIGHPHRVAILRYLLSRAACVCGDIVDRLPVAQSTVSQHLKKLKDAGWIDGEISGPRTCYCVRPEALARFHRLAASVLTSLEQPMDTLASDDIRAVVRERYGKFAQSGSSCCGGGTCCGGASDPGAIAEVIGYKPEDLKDIPAGANLGLGCGNPIEYAQLIEGETVLDLGSGAGIDCFLAARAVGPAGRAIGVDMTPAMVEKARANARQVGLANVDFRLGEIERLPVADRSVDVIISNCVVNLSPDKPQVFAEALRVLKPGGRLLISDLVLRRPLSPALKNSVEAYVGCVSGALPKADYLQHMRDAGFAEVRIVDENVYDIGLGDIGEDLYREALEAVISVKVRAIRPA